jgi:uncharacterized YigZ family protein
MTPTPRSYRTIAGDGSAEIEVRRSRFLGRVSRVESEEQARAVVESARKRYWDARHHCSAFVVGPDASLQRCSDDGEPAGTAAAPMLEVLRGRDLSDVVAVVTRWFGGVLLGAGGLVRAYGDAVRAALDTVDVVERLLMFEREIVLSHAEAGRVEGELRARGVRVLSSSYDALVTLRVAVPEAESLDADLAELTAGRRISAAVGQRWFDLPLS